MRAGLSRGPLPPAGRSCRAAPRSAAFSSGGKRRPRPRNGHDVSRPDRAPDPPPPRLPAPARGARPDRSAPQRRPQGKEGAEGRAGGGAAAAAARQGGWHRRARRAALSVPFRASKCSCLGWFTSMAPTFTLREDRRAKTLLAVKDAQPGEQGCA